MTLHYNDLSSTPLGSGGAESVGHAGHDPSEGHGEAAKKGWFSRFKPKPAAPPPPPAEPTEAEKAQQAGQASRLQEKGFQPEAHMAQPVEQAKGTEFRLTARTDLQLWNELSGMQKAIELEIRDNPHNPQLTHTQQIVNRLLVKKGENGDLEPTDIAKRAEAIKKIPPEKLKDTERIFHTDEELTAGLLAIEQYEFQLAEAYGQMITHGGERPLSATIQLPEEGKITMELLHSVHGITYAQAQEIDHDLHHGDAEKLRSHFALWGGSLGLAIGTAAQTLWSVDMGNVARGARSLGQAALELGTTIDNTGFLLPVGSTLLAAGAGLTVDIIRSRRKGKEEEGPKMIEVKFSAKKRGEKGDRVVSSLIDHASELGLAPMDPEEEKFLHHVDARITNLEGLRESLYGTMGVDIYHPSYRSMLSLNGAYELATDDPVSMGVAPPRIITERQIALNRIVKAQGKDSLADLSVVERHKAVLDSYDVAARQLCATMSDQVVKELQQRDQPKRKTLAELFEEKAKKLETGKPKEKKKEEIEEKQKQLTDTSEKHTNFSAAQTELKKIDESISEANKRLINAQEKLKARKTVYGPEREKLEQSIQALEGELRDRDARISGYRNNLDEIETSLTEARREKESTTPAKKTAAEKRIPELDDRKKRIQRSLQEDQTQRATTEGTRSQYATRYATLQDNDFDAEQTAGLEQRAVTSLQEQRQYQLKRLGYKKEEKPTTDAIEKKIREAKEEMDRLQKVVTDLNKEPKEGEKEEPDVSDQDRKTAQRLKMMAKLIRAQTEGEGEEKKTGRYNDVIGKIDAGEVPVQELASADGYDAWIELLFGETLDKEQREMMKGLISQDDMIRVAEQFYGVSRDDLLRNITFDAEPTAQPQSAAPAAEAPAPAATGTEAAAAETAPSSVPLTRENVEKWIFENDGDGLDAQKKQEILKVVYTNTAKLFSKDRLITARYAQALIYDAAKQLQYEGGEELPGVDLGPHRPQQFEIRPPSPDSGGAPAATTAETRGNTTGGGTNGGGAAQNPEAVPARTQPAAAQTETTTAPTTAATPQRPTEAPAAVTAPAQPPAAATHTETTTTPTMAAAPLIPEGALTATAVRPPAQPVEQTAIDGGTQVASVVEVQQPQSKGGFRPREWLSNMWGKESATEIRDYFETAEYRISLSPSHDQFLYATRDSGPRTNVLIKPGKSGEVDGYTVRVDHLIDYADAPANRYTLPLDSPFKKKGLLDAWYDASGRKKDAVSATDTSRRAYNKFWFRNPGDIAGNLGRNKDGDPLELVMPEHLGETFFQMTDREQKSYFSGVGQMTIKEEGFLAETERATFNLEQNEKGQWIVSSENNGKKQQVRLDGKNINKDFQAFYQKAKREKLSEAQRMHADDALRTIYRSVGEKALISYLSSQNIGGESAPAAVEPWVSPAPARQAEATSGIEHPENTIGELLIDTPEGQIEVLPPKKSRPDSPYGLLSWTSPSGYAPEGNRERENRLFFVDENGENIVVASEAVPESLGALIDRLPMDTALPESSAYRTRLANDQLWEALYENGRLINDSDEVLKRVMAGFPDELNTNEEKERIRQLASAYGITDMRTLYPTTTGDTWSMARDIAEGQLRAALDNKAESVQFAREDKTPIKNGYRDGDAYRMMTPEVMEGNLHAPREEIRYAALGHVVSETEGEQLKPAFGDLIDALIVDVPISGHPYELFFHNGRLMLGNHEEPETATSFSAVAKLSPDALGSQLPGMTESLRRNILIKLGAEAESRFLHNSAQSWASQLPAVEI